MAPVRLLTHRVNWECLRLHLHLTNGKVQSVPAERSGPGGRWVSQLTSNPNHGFLWLALRAPEAQGRGSFPMRPSQEEKEGNQPQSMEVGALQQKQVTLGPLHIEGSGSKPCP